MHAATSRWAILLLLCLASPVVLAQSELGDEFIFFVDGTNVLVPTVDSGSTVTDPLDPTNKVAKFNPGSWVEGGFAFARNQGVDATANVGATYGESDTLYFRINSDPANATQGGVSIMLADATDDSNASRADLEAGTATADHQFRLVWTIPVELHDGQWHDLAIPLPPTTYDALEAARTAGTLMDGAENWQYTGAWSLGGYGLGAVGSFTPPTSDPLWKEFGWNQLYRIGPFWDNSVGGGTIYLDDVYIGGPNTTTDGATGLPTAMSGVTFAPDDDANKVSWNAVDGAGGYNVYASLTPITDLTADDVVLLKRASLNDPTELVHRFESPHPSLSAAQTQVHYAVTTLSQFGVENPDISSSMGAIANPQLAQQPYIRELTDPEADALFDDVANGTASDANFPSDQPVFTLDTSHRTVTEGVATPPDDADISATFKVGYASDESWFIYGELTDDTVQFASEGLPGGETYLFDSIELAIGHYDVRTTDDGGDILLGSPHTTGIRGDEPDYQVRIAGRQNGAGDVIGSSTFINYFGATEGNREVPNNPTAVEKTATGWRFLTLLPMNAIQLVGTNDVLLPVPGTTEIQFIPFSISINDADGDQRESQIVYSVKANVTNQWYQSPNQWEAVAVAGRNAVATDIENGAELDGFALGQSVPNPASGVATVSFTLGTASQATVEVYNMLGQRVLQVADQPFAAGPHQVSVDTRQLAAGVYVYRLRAGDYVSTRRMTVIR